MRIIQRAVLPGTDSRQAPEGADKMRWGVVADRLGGVEHFPVGVSEQARGHLESSLCHDVAVAQVELREPSLQRPHTAPDDLGGEGGEGQLESVPSVPFRIGSQTRENPANTPETPGLKSLFGAHRLARLRLRPFMIIYPQMNVNKRK